MIYLQLCWVFIKIGILGFGGGYAMLSMIQFEIVEHHAWMTASDFADIVAISQMTPGPVSTLRFLNTETVSSPFLSVI